MAPATKAFAATIRNARNACQHWPHTSPKLSLTKALDNSSSAATIKLDPKHEQPMGTWSSDQIRDAVNENVMLTWLPGKARHNLPVITHGQGVYLYDQDGKQYLDWTSQAVCSNMGYSVPNNVLEETMRQMKELPFVYGGLGVTELRARLASLMSDLLQQATNDSQSEWGMVFPSSGSEANEAAIACARRYTNKFKVINWYRTYHGGTTNSLQATGDSRRWMGGDTVPGFIKSFSPYPLFWDYAGKTEQQRTQMALNMLEELILNEGPDTVALVQFESVIGSGGVIIPPPGYMEGVRALCDKYEILMHCDEVMVGFGRTGKLFAFQHFDGVVPDIVTAAKGITGARLPLSVMACRKHIMDAFDNKSLGWGSTYQAHPVAMACAYETIKHMIQQDVLGHVQSLEPIFSESMKTLSEKHPCVKQYRHIGMFGCFDIHLLNGEFPQLQHEAPIDAFIKYREAYAENGLIGMIRFPQSHVAPPLIITEEELLDGFDRQDKALNVLDEELGF